jgi:DNA-binding transcriptional regulator LsrR (DeoR family)
VASAPRSWLGPAELIRTASIARKYYFDGKTKSELAAEFGLSRFKIARILEDAVARGIVQITVALPAELDARLSAELCAAYGLRRALVVHALDDPDVSLTERLGRAGAELLAWAYRRAEP